MLVFADLARMGLCLLDGGKFRVLVFVAALAIVLCIIGFILAGVRRSRDRH